jgi:hypothetical protein
VSRGAQTRNLQSLPLSGGHARMPMNDGSWDEIGLHTGEADRPTFEKAVRECYEHAGIPWHANVVWVTSPLVVVLGAPLAALLIALRRCGHGEQHDGELAVIADVLAQDSVGAVLWQAVREAVKYARHERPAAVPATMEHVVDMADEGALAGRLRSAAGLVGAAMTSGAALRVMRLAVHAGVRAALDRLPREGSPLQLTLREVISRTWYQYISGQRRFAFGLLMDDLYGEGEARRACESAYHDATAAACCWYPHSEFLLVCDWPQEIHVERVGPQEQGEAETHQLHRTDGAAVSWPDGWGVHAVHGRHQSDRVPVLDLRETR